MWPISPAVPPPPVGPVHRPGQAHPGADDLVAAGARSGERLDDEAGGTRDRLRRGEVGVELLVALGEDRVREVGDGDAQVALAEVQPEGDAGAAVQRDEHGRTADRSAGPRRLAVLRLDREPLALQLGDDGRHRRAGPDPDAVRRAPRHLGRPPRPGRQRQRLDRRAEPAGAAARGLRRPGERPQHSGCADGIDRQAYPATAASTSSSASLASTRRAGAPSEHDHRTRRISPSASSSPVMSPSP